MEPDHVIIGILSLASAGLCIYCWLQDDRIEQLEEYIHRLEIRNWEEVQSRLENIRKKPRLMEHARKSDLDESLRGDTNDFIRRNKR